MKFVIQRVLSASVSVGGEKISSIEKGLMILVGLDLGDDESKLAKAAHKIAHLRVFEGLSGKPDFSLLDKGYELLLVSQFTLTGRLDKGRRPDFTGAMEPKKAHELYQQLALEFSKLGIKVSLGAFGAYMQVNMEGDGPFTLTMEG